MIRTEIHIPISPTPDFLLRIHYLAASIEMYSGLAPGTYRIIVTLGDSGRVNLDKLCPWAVLYPIEWRWVPNDEWSERATFATAYRRFRYTFDADVVVMLDGDTLVTGSLAELVNGAAATLRFHAIPAHYSPFYFANDSVDRGSPHDRWREIYRLAGLKQPVFSMEHSAWPWAKERESSHLEQLRVGPSYPNAGVIVASAEATRRIGTCIYEDLDTVLSVFNSSLSGQMALSLAITRMGLDWAPLPLRYNFPNVEQFYDTYPDDAADIRVFHFLSTAGIDRVSDFQSYEHVERVIEKPGLSAVNAVFVERLRSVHFAKVLPDLQALSA